MTKNQFLQLCNKHLIEVAVALEKDKIVEALKNKESFEKIESLLETEF